MERFEPKGDYLGGRFVRPTTVDVEIASVSARDEEVMIGRFPGARASVEAAVDDGRRAQRAWARTSMETRIDALMRLRGALESRAEDLAVAVTHEVGKPLWEARTEVKACLAKIDATVRDGLALVEAHHADGDAAWYDWQPLGVVAVVGPFNFPLHLVHGYVAPALLTGNAVVVKPSEVAPAVSQRYAECIDEAGLPPGLFSLVQGDASIGAHLVAHPGVDAVLFTGSHRAGVAIRRATVEQTGKLVALEMGGRNPAIVCADVDLDRAARDLVFGAYVTAGQRCTGTGLVLVEAAIADALTERLVDAAKRVRHGDPLRDDVLFGPVASGVARDRYLAQLGAAEAEGAEVLVRSEAFTPGPRGPYLTPGVHRVAAADTAPRYLGEEVFGPDVAILPVRDAEEATEVAASLDYGLAVSVFTESRDRFLDLRRALPYGLVNWNAPTCGASGRLPFGGLRQSGNHRPAGIFATRLCTHPKSTLEAPTDAPPRSFPGLD